MEEGGGEPVNCIMMLDAGYSFWILEAGGMLDAAEVVVWLYGDNGIS